MENNQDIFYCKWTFSTPMIHQLFPLDSSWDKYHKALYNCIKLRTTIFRLNILANQILLKPEFEFHRKIIKKCILKFFVSVDMLWKIVLNSLKPHSKAFEFSQAKVKIRQLQWWYCPWLTRLTDLNFLVDQQFRSLAYHRSFFSLFCSNFTLVLTNLE